MNLFLTSSPTGDLDGKYQVEGLDDRNGFRERVKEVWKENSRVLMITAFPENIEASEQMTDFFRGAAEKTELTFSCFDLWDCRTPVPSKEEVLSYDVIFLGGGHVPTENQFFKKLGLREKLEGYQGIVIGISAGTMNCANVVYCQPEESGEAIDPDFKRWIPGLNLTEINVLPHYQMVKYNVLDGLKLIDEISLPDSNQHDLIALIDGSFIHSDHIRTILYGEAYLLRKGTLTQICRYGQSIELDY